MREGGGGSRRRRHKGMASGKGEGEGWLEPQHFLGCYSGQLFTYSEAEDVA